MLFSQTTTLVEIKWTLHFLVKGLRIFGTDYSAGERPKGSNRKPRLRHMETLFDGPGPDVEWYEILTTAAVSIEHLGSSPSNWVDLGFWKLWVSLPLWEARRHLNSFGVHPLDVLFGGATLSLRCEYNSLSHLIGQQIRLHAGHGHHEPTSHKTTRWKYEMCSDAKHLCSREDLPSS